jgi:electron transfer flavoprotein alpha subunit
MGQNVLVVAEHFQGSVADITFEMLGLGRRLADDIGGELQVALIGGSDEMVAQLAAANRVVRVAGAGLAEFNPESYGVALDAVVEATKPQVVMIGYTSMGMDLSSALAVRQGMAHVSSVVAVDGKAGHATSQLYGGKMNVTSELGDGPCVLSVLAGASPADAEESDLTLAVEDIAMPATAGKVRFKKLIEPEAGDVDITTQDILVAIGRGVGSKDDVEVAEELATALDAAVAGSRPLIDAGWLPKTRQVGKSGLKVAPKLYLALGISGAPEHIEGMKASSTIVAVNTDKNAPIFGVAHYGLVADLFEVAEELTEALEDR